MLYSVYKSSKLLGEEGLLFLNFLYRKRLQIGEENLRFDFVLLKILVFLY